MVSYTFIGFDYDTDTCGPVTAKLEYVQPRLTFLNHL